MNNGITKRRAPAVVLGLCAHGLATARVLHRHDIDVHALEPNAALPGARTVCATVHRVASIHPPHLTQTLLDFAATLDAPEKIVLFPINDTMVGDLAENWDALSQHYVLAWSDSRDDVARLITKANLEQHTRDCGLNYPRSILIEEPLQDVSQLGDMEFPMLAKPSKPLGSFKTRRISNFDELTTIVRECPDDLPILVQEWIEGGDRDLYFCALLLDHGRDIARFEGRKLRSLPPARGQTTSAEAVVNDELYDITVRFFKDTQVSGPVSLEVKRDPKGRFWIIEPTLGRTDYWVDLCIQNGVPFPVLSYDLVTGTTDPLIAEPVRRSRWFDTDRDGFSFISLLLSGQIGFPGFPARFTYFDLRDLAPSMCALPHNLFDIIRRVFGRITGRR